MKNIAGLVCFGLISLTVYAQKIIEKNIPYTNQFIHVEVKFAYDIEVKTWDKPMVYFKADIKTEDGKYLDLYQLDIKEGSTTINMTSNAEPLLKKFWEDREKEASGKRGRYYSRNDEYEFNYVLYVPKHAKFKVSSINGNLHSELIEGDFTADLINGDIAIKAYTGNLDLTTINGEIDLKMINADLIAETIHGDIYADEHLKFTATNRHVGQKIAGRTANATNQLRLNTINGNMYLRL